MFRIAVSAGETSGDIHAANLIAALKSLRPDLAFSGLGGERMRGAGAEILMHYSEISAMGVVETFGKLGALRRAKALMLKLFAGDKPDLFIPVDFGGLNLILAKEAKKRGIPVIYFIPPKAWAWGEGRVEKIRAFTDHLIVILPFEADYWRGKGVSCDYAGSPVADHLTARAFRREDDLIGLLPGSRAGEVSRIWPHLLAAARIIAARRKTRFIAPRAEGLSPEMLKAEGVEVEIVDGRAQEVMERSRACIVASGTATLECALVGTPMVAVYRLNPLTHLIAKAVVKLSHVTLPNLIAGREVVPELIQKSPEETALKTIEIFDEGEARQNMLDGLAQIALKVGPKGASARAAAIILAKMGLSPAEAK